MDPYKILGITRDASKEQIENAFREKAAKFHPDRGGDINVYEQLKRAYKHLLIQHKKRQSQNPPLFPVSERSRQPSSEKSPISLKPKMPDRKRQTTQADQSSIMSPQIEVDTARNHLLNESVPNFHATDDSNTMEDSLELSVARVRVIPPKKKKSKFIAHSILLFVQYVFGLISAFCVAVVLLWYFGKHDPFKLFADSNPQTDIQVVSQGNSSKTEENPRVTPLKSDNRKTEDVKDKPQEVAIGKSNSRTTQEDVGPLSKLNQNPMGNQLPDSSVQPRTETIQKSVDSAVQLDQAVTNIFVANQPVARNTGDTLAEESNRESIPESPPAPKTANELLLERNGGNSESENAVEQACKWIIRHQRKDGSWSFDHQLGREDDRDSPDPGKYSEAYNAATAMALLPLLGTGSSHLNGEYQNEIKRGIDFLIKNEKIKGNLVSFWEEQGTMYSHALCTLAINEAYRMTKDRKLARFARGTILVIEEAQDPIGGGWRYKPREPGDTSVFGWQISALKHGEANKLKIKPRTLKLAEMFLESVSTEEGAFFGYMDKPRGKPADARTAIGLLSRMKMGCDVDSLSLEKGVDAIAKRGPKVGKELDCYYNYYATYLLKQYGGKYWTGWNQKMRDSLVSSQIKVGSAKGSWNPGRTYSDDKGGRLFVTSLSCLTLQVYYHGLAMNEEDESADDK